MMQMRDWISGLVGAVVFLIGISAFWGRLDFLKNIFSDSVLLWIILVMGLYLAINSIIEITNSNILGWWSFGVAAACVLIAALQALHSLGIGPSFFGLGFINGIAYNIMLAVEGIFLMLATFAMEL